MLFYYKKSLLKRKPTELNLSGFSSRTNNRKLGLSDLSASVIWLKNGPVNSNLIFISIDTLYIPLEISIPLYAYLMEEHQITRDQVIFNATHTHSAPALEKRFQYNINIDDSYISYVLNKVIGLFSSVSDHDFIEGRVSVGEVPMPENMTISRRKIGFDVRSFYLKRKIIMLPNSDNKIDNSIRLLSFFNKKNDIKLIIYNFSCHPVFDDGKEVSTDFIGVINKNIHEQMDIPALFLQGFLGDIRPNFTTSNLFKVNFINKTKIIMNGKVFKSFHKKEFNYFCTSIANTITSSCKSDSGVPLHNEMILSNKKKYTLVSETGKVSKDFDIKICLIDCIIFISIPAEVTSLYYINLAKYFSDYNIFPLSLADDTLGYLPFYEESAAGGYEVDSATNYGWDSKISQTSLENFYFSLRNSIHEIIKKVLN